MKLSKRQRDALKQMFGGLCAYCGCELGDRWHADHVKPVQRETRYISGRGHVQTGRLWRPENDTAENLVPACRACNIDKHDTAENLVPACRACNIDKHDASLEQWRKRLGDLVGVMERNHSAYRHALRFGLVTVTRQPIVFHFEKASLPLSHDNR